MLVGPRLIALFLFAPLVGCVLPDGDGGGGDTDSDNPGTTGSTPDGSTTATSGGSSGNPATTGNVDTDDPSGESSGNEETGTSTSGPSDCQVTLDEVVEDMTIDAGCDVHVATEVFVTNGATLTIREDVRLYFAQDAALRVGTDQGCQGDCTGRLAVEGTQSAPVLFTSESTSPGPGDWKGVQLGAFALAQTSLEYAVLEYAGSVTWGIYASAIHIDDGPAYDFGRISINNCETRNNAGPGMYVNFEENLTDFHPPFFASLSGNRFGDNTDVSVVIDANAAGELDNGNTFAAPVGIDKGAYGLQVDSTWSDLDVPYRIFESLTVASGQGAVLTIESGVELEFSIGTGLVIADGFAPGALRATNAHFRSGASSPFEGDWDGIFFKNETIPSFLDGCTIEHAAGYGRGDGVLTTQSASISSRLDVTNTTFANNAGEVDIDIEDADGCTKYTAASAGNVFDLTPCI